MKGSKLLLQSTIFTSKCFVPTNKFNFSKLYFAPSFSDFKGQFYDVALPLCIWCWLSKKSSYKRLTNHWLVKSLVHMDCLKIKKLLRCEICNFDCLKNKSFVSITVKFMYFVSAKPSNLLFCTRHFVKMISFLLILFYLTNFSQCCKRVSFLYALLQNASFN